MGTEVMEPLTALEIRGQVNRIQEVMKAVMQSGQHYGVVPGCGTKPTLLKPGAEKLMATFRLAVEPEVQDMSDEHARRYRVVAKVTAQSTGVFLGAGVGECSSDEEKYAWREAVCKEEWDETDPVERRNKWKKGNPPYVLHQIKTNPADLANTILKMAKKRALIDAILTVTGASDIFTQDIEDLPEEVLSAKANGKKQAKPEDGLKDTKAGSPPPAANVPDHPASQDAPAPFIWRVGADHKGKPVTDIPDKYLEWAKTNMKLQDHADAARLELDRRQAQASFAEEGAE